MSHDWRQHPKLQPRFHPNAPDDLQVIVHDGGPRFTQAVPELVWVTVTSALGPDLFEGRVLNQPEQLKTVSEGMTIKFVVPHGDHPLMVTDKYLAERDRWLVHGCNQCGLDELFDAPSDLIRVIFPQLPADDSLEMFSSFCGLCGGAQIVQDRNAELDAVAVARSQKPRKWWQIWR